MNATNLIFSKANRRGFISRLMVALGARKVSKACGAEAATAGARQVDAPVDSTKSSTGQVAAPPHQGGYIRPGTIEVVHQKFDLVVVGGGIAGTCAAISAARNGTRVALVHERAMLGGNSSSEVCLYPEDTLAYNPWIKETGIFEEIMNEERARNWVLLGEGMINSQWDLVLYEWAIREKNLTLFLNTSMREVEMANRQEIRAIRAVQLGSEKGFILQAPLFVDATGDGVLAYRAGAEFRWGQEAREEYHELLAPVRATDAVMGNTLYFRAHDVGKPIKFKKPEWAVAFDTEADLTGRDHGFFEAGYWWIEVGYPLHPIKDNEAIRDEAMRQLLGVWDHIKNRCTNDQIRARAANYALEFVAFWPYKRASRRILGDYVLREQDVRDPQVRHDDIAYGAWGTDIHTPGGILNRHAPPYLMPTEDANFQERGTIPYGIPLRSCYSRDVHNLLAAGRPISTSYVAFGSSRVLPTGAIVGQGVGTASALCTKYKCNPRDIVENHAIELQQLLLRQDASIPGVQNTDPNDLARGAQVITSSEGPLVFPESQTFYPARFPLAELFPVSTNLLESIDLFLRSTLKTSVRINLVLRKAAHVWDFRSEGDVAAASATIPAGYQGFVRFVLNADTQPGTLYYVHIPAHPGIAWALFDDPEEQPSLVPVGTTAADLPGGAYWRPLNGDENVTGKSFVIRLNPEQRPYGPQNVVRGTNHPDRWTNFFTSDPTQPLPAWVELRLPQVVSFNLVQITFDTNMNRRTRLGLYRYPECVKRYDIAVWSGAGWKVVAEENENYNRWRVHRFDAITSDRLRVNVYETNGAKAARIYEVRIYNEKQA